MANSIVIYDACVLYPAPLRDLLISLGQTSLYKARWTQHIHDEWIRNVLSNRPDLNKEKLERTRNLMDKSIRDCLVEGYESIIPILKLPDPNDHHVLAAAIRANADTILTFNLKDFPKVCLQPYDIEIQHPDDFISSWIDIVPGLVCSTIKRLRMGLKNPPKNSEQYLEILERQSLPQTVSLLQQYNSLI